MKVFIIGDSISVHYGPYLENYLKGIAEYCIKDGTIEALTNLDIPQGANGGDSSRVLEYLKARAAKDPIIANYILLNCGLHDIKTTPETNFKQVPIEQYTENLKKIISFSKENRQKIVWISTTPADENVHNSRQHEFHRFKADCIAYNKAANSIMVEAGIPIIDLYTFTNNLGDDLYCDHVHFKEHIREKQAAFIAGYISSTIQR